MNGIQSEVRRLYRLDADYECRPFHFLGLFASDIAVDFLLYMQSFRAAGATSDSEP
jgi:hypothetical protein